MADQRRAGQALMADGITEGRQAQVKQIPTELHKVQTTTLLEIHL